MSKTGTKSNQIVNMLENLLKLNPYMRNSARECLKNKIFDPYRNVVKETIINEMYKKRHEADNQYQINLHIDQPDVFDYSNNSACKYQLNDIKMMLL